MNTSRPIILNYVGECTLAGTGHYARVFTKINNKLRCGQFPSTISLLCHLLLEAQQIESVTTPLITFFPSRLNPPLPPCAVQSVVVNVKTSRHYQRIFLFSFSYRELS